MKLALGLGCDRGTPAATIVQAITEALAQAGATLADIHAVASIDLKADEIGLATVAAAHGWTICFYPACVLAEVEVPNPSATVRKYTGTPSVSEAAALLAAGRADEMRALVVEKHRLRGPDGRHATVSVARMRSPAPSPESPEPEIP